MKHSTQGLLVPALAMAFLVSTPTWAGTPKVDTSEWHIKEIYNYLQEAGEDLYSEEIRRYCQFLIDSQDPERGTFSDKFGDYIYSVKAYYLLKRFGYEPQYPLAVLQQVGKDLHYGCVSDDSDVIVSETIAPERFRQWLDRVRATYDAYAAGSLIGHFIAPHVMNLKKAGKTIQDSPYIPVLQQWLLENQGENGFWNRPDDPDSNGWNGVMKMDQALGAAELKLPRQDRMLTTVLKYQDPADGTFTAAGGCTNHNALHTLRQWSKRNDLLMWPKIFLAMESFIDGLERRWDAETGLFRAPPGFNGAPDEWATKMADSEAGNVIGYCTILLKPENADRIASGAQEGITRDLIRSLLVRAIGLAKLSSDKSRELAKA